MVKTLRLEGFRRSGDGRSDGRCCNN